MWSNGKLRWVAVSRRDIMLRSVPSCFMSAACTFFNCTRVGVGGQDQVQRVLRIDQPDQPGHGSSSCMVARGSLRVSAVCTFRTRSTLYATTCPSLALAMFDAIGTSGSFAYLTAAPVMHWPQRSFLYRPVQCLNLQRTHSSSC